MIWSRLWPILLAIQLTPCTPFSYRPIEPRHSCRDHFLHGESGSKVLPLSADGQDVFQVECEMPADPDSNLPVGVVVHNALERWHRLDGEEKTVGYQISNWAFLRWTMEQSDTCYQELSVSWVPDLSSDKTIEFTVESIQGQKRTFHFNSSKSTTEEVFVLENRDAGVLHVFPPARTANLSIELRTTALRCRQPVVKQARCLFELNSRADRVGADLRGFHSVGFAFRTDVPSTPFLTLTGPDGVVRVDVLDGYLIAVNQLVHPVKLLADGRWHTAVLDVRNLVLHVDGKHNTAISLNNSGRFKRVDDVEVVLNGSVTAFRLDDGPWECEGSTRLRVFKTQRILRKICPAYAAGYCQCRAPNSALTPRGQRQNARCAPPDPAKAFALIRNATHLSFFYYSQFRGQETISVLFKSDSDLGLVLLGQHKESTKSKQRYQVQFEGELMTAVSCLIEQNQQYVCRTCSIRRAGGFGRNEWVRVSLFYYQNYQFLTVDEQICKLSPNERGFALSDLYQMGALISDVLFVGGTYYKKAEPRGMASRVRDDFRNNFFENTLEKAPSLRGCLAELRVGGRTLDLAELLRVQNQLVSADPNRPVFAIEPGCLDCTDLLDQCRGAPCRAASPLQPRHAVCDCARDFAAQSPLDGACVQQEHDKYRPSGLKLSDAEATPVEQGLGFVKQSAVQQVWALLRFPATNHKMAVLVDLGEVRILSGEYGRRVRLEVGELHEEFWVRGGDDRLHLLALHRNPSMSASGVARTLTARLDGDLRELPLSRIPLHAGSTVTITPVRSQSAAFAGCISDLSISFDADEDPSSLDYNPYLQHQQQQPQYALLAGLLQRPVVAPNVSRLLLFGDACGVRDPTLWAANSTSPGLVGPFDPAGTRQAYNNTERTSLLSWLVTALLSLLVLCLLCGYCYKRGRKHTYKTTASGYTPADEKLLMNGENYTDGTSNGSPPPKVRIDLTDANSPLTPTRPIVTGGKPVVIEEKMEPDDDFISASATRPVAVRRISATPQTPPSAESKAPIARTEDV